MQSPCDKNLTRALDIAEALLQLANDGDSCREDVGCGILYGVLRDAGYKIKSLAQGEMAQHRKHPKPSGSGVMSAHKRS